MSTMAKGDLFYSPHSPFSSLPFCLSFLVLDTCLSSVYQDVDFYGADYRTLFTADYKECQRACTSDPGCQFFSWLNDDFARPQYKYTTCL